MHVNSNVFHEFTRTSRKLVFVKNKAEVDRVRGCIKFEDDNILA